MNVSNLNAGDWVALTGYPTAFAAAPYDFAATTVVRPDLTSVDARYDARFLAEDETNSVTIDSNQLVLADAFRDKLNFKGLRIELSDEVVVTRVAGTAEEGRYGIREGRDTIRRMGHHGGHGEVEMYLSYDDFVAALSAKLEDGQAVSHLISSGLINAETGLMSANHITVKLK